MSAGFAWSARRKAQVAYLTKAVATLDSVLESIDIVSSYFRERSVDGSGAQWRAVSFDLRIHAVLANEVLARVIANKPHLDWHCFDKSDPIVFDESDQEWAKVAGKGFALLLAGLAEHVGNELGGSGRDRTKAVRNFIEGHQARLLRRIALLTPRPGPVAKTLPRN